MGVIFAIGAVVVSMEGGPGWLAFVTLGIALAVGVFEKA